MAEKETDLTAPTGHTDAVGEAEQAEPSSAAPQGDPSAAAPQGEPTPATSQSDPTPAAKPVRASRSGAGGRWAGWAALVLVVILAIYFFRWSERTGRELARRVQEGELKMAQSDAQQRQSQDLLRDLQNRAAVSEAKLGEVLGQQAQLELLYRAVTEDTIDAMLADVESSIALAAQQLAAAGNPQGPLIALQGAEHRLARGNDARLVPLRAAIARDIERLRAAAGGDSVALAMRLDGLIGKIEDLPLLATQARPAFEPAKGGIAPGDERAGETPPPGWLSRLLSMGALRAELAQLVRVRRIDAPDAALVAPEQAYFLRENLRLQLLNARLTLLSRNDALFRNDLERAIGWLGTYYDRTDKQVAATIEQLRQLRAARASGEIPTVSESLTAVRAARGVRDAKR